MFHIQKSPGSNKKNIMEIRNYSEWNDNENMTYQFFFDVAKVILRKCRALNTLGKKGENQLSKHIF